MLYNIFLLIILNRVSGSVISTLPFIGYQPPLLETGSVRAFTAPVGYWISAYTINLIRIKGTTPPTFQVGLGISGFDLKFNQDNTTQVAYSSWVSASSAINFEITIVIQHDNLFNFFQINYLVQDPTLVGIRMWSTLQIMGRNLTTATPYNNPHTFGFLSDIGQPYLILIGFNAMKLTYMDNTFASFDVSCTITPVAVGNYNDYMLTITGNGAFIDLINLYYIFLDPAFNNDYNKQNIIVSQPIIVNSIISFDSYCFTTYDITFLNSFILVNTFDSNAFQSYFQFYISVDKLKLKKTSTLRQLNSYALLIYQRKCNQPYFYDQSQLQCRMCFTNCLQCQDSNFCLQCQANFTLSLGQLSCTCPHPVISGICFDFDSSPMKGCTSAIIQSGDIVCLMCNPTLKQNYDGGCECKAGYFLNNLTNLCQEKCGDSLIFDAECDDGNTNDNDGCSSQCLRQSYFKCDNNKPSYCWSLIYLELQVTAINKNQENSAVLQVSPKKSPLPFSLNFSDFPSGSLRLFLITSQSPFHEIQLKTTLISVQSNTLSLSFDYDFSIEGMDAYLDADTSHTRYPEENSKLSFKMNGSNQPLAFSSFTELFKGASMGMMIETIFMIFILLIGLLAPKFIGLEAVTTLQLIFFSQLLISEPGKWPVGFMMFENFRFANGYNDALTLTSYASDFDTERKFRLLGIDKRLIENFNVSFIFLFLFFCWFAITIVFRFKNERQLLELQDQDEMCTPVQLKEKQDKLRFWLKVNDLSYQCVSQVSMWCILQVLCGFGAQFQISNSDVILLQNSTLYYRLDQILFILSSFIIFFIGLNNFRNIFLSDLTMAKIKQRPMELDYKRAYFVYLLLMGFCIIICNEEDLFGMFFAVVALILHILYVILLISINPYKMSLRIHTVGLFACQSVYGVFLIAINIINFASEFSEVLMLILGYFILILCFVIVFITGVRLYYEYRYGQALEKELQRQRQLQQKRKLEEQQMELKKKMKRMEEQARKKLTNQEGKRLNNVFLIENQQKQQQMKDLLAWLDSRIHWSKEQKQEYYYKYFESKPLEWLKNNDKKAYQNKLKQIQEKSKVEQQKRNKNISDPQYIAIVKNLKEDFINKYKYAQ